MEDGSLVGEWLATTLRSAVATTKVDCILTIPSIVVIVIVASISASPRP